MLEFLNPPISAHTSFVRDLQHVVGPEMYTDIMWLIRDAQYTGAVIASAAWPAKAVDTLEPTALLAKPTLVQMVKPKANQRG